MPPPSSPATPATPVSPDEAPSCPLPFLPALSSAYVKPPYAPEQVYSVSTDENASPKSGNLELVHKIEFGALTYVGAVDENLICSICRNPFMDPVMIACTHIFCYPCLEESMEHSASCPIDRDPVPNDEEYFVRAPNIIRNQVDALMVECPTCSTPVIRSEVETHLKKYCPEARMACPGKNTERGCSFEILRKHLTSSCLHYEETCPDCSEKCLKVDMERHRDIQCSKRLRTCPLCEAEYPFSKYLQHLSVCPEVEIPCRWASSGCKVTAKRRTMPSHEEDCDYKLLGEQINELRKQVGELKCELGELTKERASQDRRIKGLETTMNNFRIPLDDFDGNNSLSAPLESDLVPPTDFHHVMSLMDIQQEHIRNISNNMTELEARYSTLLFNETLRIRNDLAELKSVQQNMGAHVRWLLKFRVQENKRVGGNGAGIGNNGEGSQNGGGSSVGNRRSSDSLDEAPRL